MRAHRRRGRQHARVAAQGMRTKRPPLRSQRLRPAPSASPRVRSPRQRLQKTLAGAAALPNRLPRLAPWLGARLPWLRAQPPGPTGVRPPPPCCRPMRDHLLPIRVDVEVDGQRYRGIFTWNWIQRGTWRALLASFISSSRRVLALCLDGLASPLRLAGRSRFEIISLAKAPSGRSRTSSCRPISFPRCSSSFRCLSFLLPYG